MKEINGAFVATTIPKRTREMHKGNCGRVLLVAGGAGMTGAAALSAEAALRCGSGLVYICTPRENFPVVQTLVPEAVLSEWDDVSGKLTTCRGEGGYDAVAFGPGMGAGEEASRMLKTVLEGYEGPLVLDADGLNLLAAAPDLTELVRRRSGDTVLTPHVGEARRLLPDAPVGEKDKREHMARGISERYRSITVMKGAGTLVARRDPVDGEAEMWRNPTGNPGMATAGSGDVLTGVIVSLAGQGMSLWNAARTGVWIHGEAGDMAAEDKGEHGMIARDILENLPYVIKNIIEH